MPAWFEALNGDFRYQLTPIGAAAPNLHIARGMARNVFRIAGGRPGMKVSWQVTGIRKDRWAKKNRIQVEEKKPRQERGYYLHPQLYGQPKEKGIGARRQAELAERRRRVLKTAKPGKTRRGITVPESLLSAKLRAKRTAAKFSRTPAQR